MRHCRLNAGAANDFLTVTPSPPIAILGRLRIPTDVAMKCHHGIAGYLPRLPVGQPLGRDSCGSTPFHEAIATLIKAPSASRTHLYAQGI